MLEAGPLADRGAPDSVLLQQLFLLPQDHPVELNGLRQNRRDDRQELLVAREVVVVDEGLIHRERPRRPALDLDGNAEEADGCFQARQVAATEGAVEEIGLLANVGDDPSATCSDDIAGDAFAQGVGSSIDLLFRETHCCFNAQPPDRLVEQDERAAEHM